MHGLIAWFTRNGVAANLLMVAILLGGWVALQTGIPTEVFPDFELDMVNVTVPYRGATPAEVEESVVIRIEEAIQDLPGIKRILSTASEGVGSVRVEVDQGYDSRDLLNDIKNRVDSINTFPVETEKPVVSLVQPRSEVINVVLAAEMAERDLRRLGEEIRDEIANLPGITQVGLGGVRPYEIAIEVSEKTLQRYGLTLTEVANAVRRSSVNLPGGVIKSPGGEVLLRTFGQAYTGEEFADIVLLTRPDGSRITLGDIADIKDDFEETPLYARYNGKPCVLISVARVGDQNAITMARTVKEYLTQRQRTLPPGVELSYWNDRSRIVQARLQTLLNNAWQGGALVLLVLALFLRPAVAFWVFLGIPVSFMGAILLMPWLGVTINVITLFAFILVLGIVVDDAIVVGENVFTHMQRGKDGLRAAIEGSQEVSVAVVFGVLTTVVAFVPLTMIEGFRGKIFMQIPLIVIPVLLFSLLESKLILPAHLKHLHVGGKDSRLERGALAWLLRLQRRVAEGMEWFARRVYQPVLALALRRRYSTLCVFLGALAIIAALIASNRIVFVFFPRVQGERVTAALTMAEGTPTEVTARHIRRIEEAARELQQKYVDPTTGRSVVEGIMAVVGGQGITGGRGRGRSGRSHLGEVAMQITPPEERQLPVTSTKLANEWRERIGPIPGAQDLNFRAEIGRASSPIDIQLTGPSFEDLSAAADRLKQRLAQYPELFDITDSYQEGKPEIRLRIKPEAEALGLSMQDLARQAREAFYGAEAQRIQRGRDDVRVMVRYPLEERASLDSLETMRIRTPAGAEVPFGSVAEVHVATSYATITRIDRNRTVNVTADADKEKANLEVIKRDLAAFLPKLVSQYRGMSWSFEGEAREQAESFGALEVGGILVLFAIYAMLAIPFRSYLQPAIVMSVIPFALCGAVVGHLIMGFQLSIMSVFGMLALAGVAVNDSLVLVDYINRRRAEGMPLGEAVRTAGVARFRAIMLTSLTTFCGLMPLLIEKSTQAQFLIPMGISLGWGVLLATVVTLLLVPINYLLLEDLRRVWRRYWAWQTGRDERAPAGSAPDAA